tara:strand:+ start:651 stop:1829 length:1179 start_codon:yes stop_codon:yes gene_type:complete
MDIKRHRFALMFVIIIASLLISFLLGKLKSPPEKMTISTEPLVSTMVVAYDSINISIESQGTVMPLDATKISAEVSGTIINISSKFIPGGVFSNDDVLITIDPDNYFAAQEKSKALLEQRQNEFDDAINLREKGYLSESEYLSAATALASAKSELVKADKNLNRTKVKLPYDGMVLSKDIGLGQYVTVGTPLGITFATEYAEVRLPLSDRDLSFIQLPTAKKLLDSGVGNGPKVIFAAEQLGPLARWEGQIVRSEGVVDEKTRVTYAVARIDDPYALKDASSSLPLPMGTFVSADIKTRTDYTVIPIPRAALKNNRQVIVVNPENRIQLKDVKILNADAKYAYIIDGLDEGERIIITPIENAMNGMVVRTNVNENKLITVLTKDDDLSVNEK